MSASSLMPKNVTNLEIVEEPSFDDYVELVNQQRLILIDRLRVTEWDDQRRGGYTRMILWRSLSFWQMIRWEKWLITWRSHQAEICFRLSSKSAQIVSSGQAWERSNWLDAHLETWSCHKPHSIIWTFSEHLTIPDQEIHRVYKTDQQYDKWDNFPLHYH